MAGEQCDADLTHEERLSLIEEAIMTPRRISSDGIDATSRSAEDLIRLLNYTASSRRNGLWACTRHQIRPPDALGTNRGSLP
jgi:hypothetical protein